MAATGQHCWVVRANRRVDPTVLEGRWHSELEVDREEASASSGQGLKSTMARVSGFNKNTDVTIEVLEGSAFLLAVAQRFVGQAS